MRTRELWREENDRRTFWLVVCIPFGWDLDADWGFLSKGGFAWFECLLNRE